MLELARRLASPIPPLPRQNGFTVCVFNNGRARLLPSPRMFSSSEEDQGSAGASPYRWVALLVAERLDRIEAGGFEGGDQTREDANQHAEQERQCYRFN